MTVLVTGAAGFIGQALCRALHAQGRQVRAMVRSHPVSPIGPDIDYRQLDLAKPVDWRSHLEGVDTVYHLAWSTIPASAESAPAHDLSLNVGALIGLLEAAQHHERIRVVFPSSGGTVYGPSEVLPIPEDHPRHPISAYGVAKLAAESYINFYRVAHGVNSVILRISNPYGPGQNPAKGLGVVTHFARAAAVGRPLTLFGEGLTVRDFVYIDDLVEAMLSAGEKRAIHGPINIGAGVGHSLCDIIALLEQHFQRPMTVIQKPGRLFDVPACVLDTTRARQYLGWAPRLSFGEGLHRLLAEITAA